MTAFMIKPLEARRKKTFGDAAVGDLVTDRKKEYKKIFKKYLTKKYVSYYWRIFINTFFDQNTSFLSVLELWGDGGGDRHTYIATCRLKWPRGRFREKSSTKANFERNWQTLPLYNNHNFTESILRLIQSIRRDVCAWQGTGESACDSLKERDGDFLWKMLK